MQGADRSQQLLTSSVQPPVLTIPRWGQQLTPMVAVMSSSFSPLPSRMPTVRLRDCRHTKVRCRREAVTTRTWQDAERSCEKQMAQEQEADSRLPASSGSSRGWFSTRPRLRPPLRAHRAPRPHQVAGAGQHNVADAGQASQRQRAGTSSNCRVGKPLVSSVCSSHGSPVWAGRAPAGVRARASIAGRPSLAPATQRQAPAAPARRVISSSPRVMSAARPLEPKPSPAGGARHVGDGVRVLLRAGVCRPPSCLPHVNSAQTAPCEPQFSDPTNPQGQPHKLRGVARTRHQATCPHTIRDAAGNGQHVLQRAPQLHARHIVGAIAAEARGGHHLLQAAGRDGLGDQKRAGAERTHC